MPEALFWLLLTGEIPTESQVQALSKDWASRAALPSHVVTMLNNFPSNLHPMSQLVCAVAALNSESKFAKAYTEGIHKSKYWEVSHLFQHLVEAFLMLLCVLNAFLVLIPAFVSNQRNCR